MSGIFPNAEQGGIAPGVTVPESYDPVHDPIGTLALYFSQNCGVRLTAEVLNSIISQIAAAIDFAGIAYDATGDHKDLSTAVQYYIQKNLGGYIELAGGPAAYTATGTPPFLEYTQGMLVLAKVPPGANNVPGATLAVDGHPAAPIVRPDGSSVAGGDLIQATIVALTYNSGKWQLLSNSGADFMTLARQRLLIFPEVLNTAGHFAVVSPGAGTVVIPAAVPFLHRGIYLDNTTNYPAPSLTFATAANKTYHLRWTPLGGFALKDIADVAYNPTGLLETDAKFDSTYDDMLLARVVTSGANIATITNLVNRNDLWGRDTKSGAGSLINPNLQYTFTPTVTVNWARAPKNYPIFASAGGNGGTVEQTTAVYNINVTRYTIVATADVNFLESAITPTGVTMLMNFDFAA